MDADNIVDVAHGLAGIDYIPTAGFFQRLIAHSITKMPSMQPEALVKLSQAFIVLHTGQDTMVPAAWAEALLTRCQACLPNCQVSEIAGVLAAVAHVRHHPEPAFMAAAAQQAARTAAIAHPTAIATLLWSYAMLGYKPQPQLLHQYLAVLQPALRLLGGRDFANVTWALSCLRHRPGAAWLGQYMTEAIAKAPYMDTQSLTDMAWSLACFGAQPDRGFLKMLANCVLNKLTDFDSNNMAVMLWALQQLGYVPESNVVMDAMAGQLLAPPADQAASAGSGSPPGSLSTAVDIDNDMSLLGGGEVYDQHQYSHDNHGGVDEDDEDDNGDFDDGDLADFEGVSDVDSDEGDDVAL